MSRRGNSEGSIYQREDGRWCATVHDGYRDGKRHRKYIYRDTRTEVQNELKRVLRAQQLGLPMESDRLTVGDWLKQWLEMQKPPATKPKTYTAYEYQVRIHLIPAFGKRPLVKLQPQEVRAFMQTKAAGGLSPKSIRHFRATLRAALNVAMRDGMVARNVAALVKPPRLQKGALHVFTKKQALLFLDLARGHRLEAIYTVALSLGMREGEILGLRWQDVDLDAGTLEISHTLQRVKRPGAKKGKLELIPPKSDRSGRILALPQVVHTALLAHRNRQEKERKEAGSNWHETGMVFTTGIGTLLDQRNMLRAFYPIINTPDPSDPEPDRKKKRKLLPRLRFHDLRHSAATLLLVQGVHPRAIMELLGHSSFTLTMNTYGHVLEEMKKETARQADAVFSQSEDSSGVPIAQPVQRPSAVPLN
ncbi:MAG TPA: site-specific integrase [Bryobacteraceae bacterium]|jgi:integrase|nr:site-specific integrase [Bryobacteraceae bacterium]